MIYFISTLFSFKPKDIFFWIRKIIHFQEVSSRFPFQSFVPNPGTKGFSLQSGLKEKILVFYHDSRKRKTGILELRLVGCKLMKKLFCYFFFTIKNGTSTVC